MHILNAAIKVKILVSMCANYTTAGLQDHSRKQNYVHYFLYLPTVFNQKQLILGNWLELRLEWHFKKPRGQYTSSEVAIT